MEIDKDQPDDTFQAVPAVPIDHTLVDTDQAQVSAPALEMIGKYRIKRLIGSGGMGTVYLAQQEKPLRDVAIKVMNAGVVSPKSLRRFEFEFQTLGRLKHHVIAQVYEADTFDNGNGPRPYFVMEYVSSAKELGEYARTKQLDLAARLEIFRVVCEGIEYGHRRGVIHRDLKPANILVDAVGRPKIIDFGVARTTDSDAMGATLSTESGHLVGTLQYMSPEQVELGELPVCLATPERFVRLYTLWHLADPGGGHDAKAAEYRAMLEPVQSN